MEMSVQLQSLVSSEKTPKPWWWDHNVMTTKFPLSLLDIHYFYDRTVYAVRNRWMEKHLLVQLDHRAQMLTAPCGIEVRHWIRMTKVSGLVPNKIQSRRFSVCISFIFCEMLFSCHLHICIPSGLFPWHVSITILKAFLRYPTPPAHLIALI
jgi:hypothetical protein